MTEKDLIDRDLVKMIEWWENLVTIFDQIKDKIPPTRNVDILSEITAFQQDINNRIEYIKKCQSEGTYMSTSDYFASTRESMKSFGQILDKLEQK